MMILLDESNGLAVNSVDISWVAHEGSGSEQALLVVMRSGAKLIVKNRAPGPNGQPGVHIYEVHRRNLDAK